MATFIKVKDTIYKVKAKDEDYYYADELQIRKEYTLDKNESDNNIKTFFFKSDSHKLGKINRFHRTLKEKLLKYFIANDNTRWIDVIDKIIKNYNNTVNSSTGYTPTEASKPFIQTQLISNDREKTEHFTEATIKVGDKCRILKDKVLFESVWFEELCGRTQLGAVC